MSLNRSSRYVAALAVAGTALAATPHVAAASPHIAGTSVAVSSVQSGHSAHVQRVVLNTGATLQGPASSGVQVMSSDQPRANFFGGFMDLIKSIWSWIAKLLGLGGGVKDPVKDPGGGTKPQPVRPTATVTPTIRPTATPTTKPTVNPTITPTTNPTTKPTTKPTPTITHTNGPIGNPGLKPTPQPTLTPTPTPTATATSNPGGSAWLAELNRIRAEKGLNPVVEDPTLSSECVKHVNYMKKWGMEGHFEVEGRPEYTPQGHKCAKESNLVSGARNELDSFRIWVGSPAHYRGMVRPNLKRVGFAYGNGYGALNVIAGLGR